MSELIRVEIQRSKWLRGKGVGMLRDSCGLQCCLGFVAVAAGFSEDAIYEQNTVSDMCDGLDNSIETIQNVLIRPLVHIDHADEDDEDDDQNIVGITGSTLENDLVMINDAEGIDDTERETRLNQHAAKGGIEFVFVD